jgi:hypothetical protein
MIKKIKREVKMVKNGRVIMKINKNMGIIIKKMKREIMKKLK